MSRPYKKESKSSKICSSKIKNQYVASSVNIVEGGHKQITLKETHEVQSSVNTVMQKRIKGIVTPSLKNLNCSCKEQCDSKDEQ